MISGKTLRSLWLALLIFCHCTRAAEPVEYQSGYGDVPEFGGPDSVGEDLKAGDEIRPTRFRFEPLDRLLNTYFDTKRRLDDQFGIALGLRYYQLSQYASSSRDDHGSAGGVFRFQGSWTVYGGEGENSGSLQWRVENRSNIGKLQSPSELSGNSGIAALNTGFAYTADFDTDLSVMSWMQVFRNGRSGFVLGRLPYPSYLDSIRFQTFTGGFLNRGFFINPTLGTTGIGALGVAAKSFIDEQFWVGAQIYDANAVSGSFDMDTVREEEWLSAVEFGWTPGYAQRDDKRIQFTYWHKDERRQAGISEGRGWTASAVWRLSQALIPFMRLGHSDGGAGVQAESAVSVGVEIITGFSETLSLGAGWAEPSEETHGPGLRDEWVLETSYMFQLSENISLTPDVQLLFNPAKNRNRDRLWVFSFRIMFMF